MADIELVIKISKEDYEIMKHNIAINNPLCPLNQKEMVSKIAQGTPLPKGHDRLVEARAVVKALFDKKTIYDVPTIIEADKEKEE